MLQNHASENIEQVQKNRRLIIVEIDYCWVKSTTSKSEKNGQSRLGSYFYVLILYVIFKVSENNLSTLQIDEAAIHVFL